MLLSLDNEGHGLRMAQGFPVPRVASIKYSFYDIT